MGKYGSVSSAIARIKWGMAKTKKLRGGVEKLIFSVKQKPRADLTPLRFHHPLPSKLHGSGSYHDGTPTLRMRCSPLGMLTNKDLTPNLLSCGEKNSWGRIRN